MALLREGCYNFCKYKRYYPFVCNFRYSVFPSWFATPIATKKEIMELEAEGKTRELKVIPVKPAVSSASESLFDDPVLKKFTNMTMKWSNKILARELMDETFAKIKRIQLGKYHEASEEERKDIILNPLEVFHMAVENCKPIMTLTPIKKGGITYQVPVPVTANKSSFMAMKWLIMCARDKKGSTKFTDLLSKELVDASLNQGKVIKRKTDLHKHCEENKAYAHYRWS